MYDEEKNVEKKRERKTETEISPLLCRSTLKEGTYLHFRSNHYAYVLRQCSNNFTTNFYLVKFRNLY